jgi:hypothetical protein
MKQHSCFPSLRSCQRQIRDFRLRSGKGVWLTFAPGSVLLPLRRCGWLLLVVACLSGAGPLRGAVKFWDGSASGNWSNGANWAGGVAPVAGDDLVFQVNTLVSRLVVTNDFSPNRAFTSILFQGSNYVVRGNALLLTNGLTSINAVGPNTINADVDVRASQTWEANGSIAVLDINGDINPTPPR